MRPFMPSWMRVTILSAVSVVPFTTADWNTTTSPGPVRSIAFSFSLAGEPARASSSVGFGASGRRAGRSLEFGFAC